MTPNQVVAYNLKLARAHHGWTQGHAAERLEPLLGERWSKATFSAAERSVAGKRVREFNADELVAFAQAFKLPLAWFFMPPIHDPWERMVNLERVVGFTPPERAKAPAVTPDTLVDLVLGDEGTEEMLLNRLAACWPELSAETRARYADRAAPALRGLYPDAPLPPIDTRPEQEEGTS